MQWKPETPKAMKFEVWGQEGQPILPIIFRDDTQRVLAIVHKLKVNGFICGAVVAPACSMRTPRLRVTCGSNFTKESIDRFSELLRDISEETPSSGIYD